MTNIEARHIPVGAAAKLFFRIGRNPPSVLGIPEKYGDVAELSILGKRLYVVSDAKMALELFGMKSKTLEKDFFDHEIFKDIT